MESTIGRTDALLRWRKYRNNTSESEVAGESAPSGRGRRQAWTKVLNTPWSLALITFLISFAALVAHVHHHTRQAPAHHAAPPAHKSHTVPVEHTYLTRHETGVTEWQNIDTTKPQTLKKHVKFGQPFRETPSILLSVSFVVPNNAHASWEYDVYQASPEGFEVYYTTFDHVANHSFQLTWLAVGR